MTLLSYFKWNQYPWYNNKPEVSPQASLPEWFTVPGNPINTRQEHLVISYFSLQDIFAYTYGSFLTTAAHLDLNTYMLKEGDEDKRVREETLNPKKHPPPLKKPKLPKSAVFQAKMLLLFNILTYISLPFSISLFSSMQLSVGLTHDISWVLIIKADWSFTKSKNKLKPAGSKEAPGTVLAAPRSEWSVSIVGFISVYMEAINDDLTLGTNNVIWHINNKFMESKKPTSKQMRASQKPFIRLSSEDLGEVN